jgi:hypothetical protein
MEGVGEALAELVASGLSPAEIAWVMGDVVDGGGAADEAAVLALILADVEDQASERAAAELVAAELAAGVVDGYEAASTGGAVFDALVSDGMAPEQAAAVVACMTEDNAAAVVVETPVDEDVEAAAAAEVAFEAESREHSARAMAVEAGETGARPDFEGLPRCPHCGRAIEVLAANCRIFVCAFNPVTKKQWGPHDEAGARASAEPLVGCRKQMELMGEGAGQWMVRCTGK